MVVGTTAKRGATMCFCSVESMKAGRRIEMDGSFAVEMWLGRAFGGQGWQSAFTLSKTGFSGSLMRVVKAKSAIVKLRAQLECAMLGGLSAVV